MNHTKTKAIIITLVVFIAIIVGIIAYNIINSPSKDDRYIGYVRVYFYHNTTYERIQNITKAENLTIESNYTTDLPMGGGNREKFKVIHYQAERWEQGEQIKSTLIIYPEIYNIEMYKKM